MDNRLTLTILPPGLRLLRSAQAPPQGQPGPARATTRALPLDGWRRIPAGWGHATPEGDGFHVAQGLAGQFGDNGVRVAVQQDQHADPGRARPVAGLGGCRTGGCRWGRRFRSAVGVLGPLRSARFQDPGTEGTVSRSWTLPAWSAVPD